MAIKEFQFGPDNYLEDGYFDGDYTDPGRGRFLVQCDIDKIYGGVVLTGEYFEDNYIDGTYFHDNSIRFSLSADFDIIVLAESSLESYMADDYFEDEYIGTRGGRATLSATAERTRTADATISATATITDTSTRVRIADSTISASASTSCVISHIEGADLIALAEAQMAAQAVSIRDSEAQPFSSFTASSYVIRIKGLTFSEGADFGLTSDVNKNAVFSTNVEAAFSISASLSKIRKAEANITSTATATAQPEVYQLRARTAVSPTTNTGGNFTTASIDTTVKKFGLGSAGFTKGTRIYPIGNENSHSASKKITVNGSTFVIVHPGYTWTSTNGTTWTRSTNDLTEHLQEVRKTGSYFVGISNETTDRVWYSTNGTTWSYNDSLASVNNLYADSRRGITYINGAYYVFDTAILGSNGRLTWAFTTNFSSWSENGGFNLNNNIETPNIQSFYYNESNGEFYMSVSPRFGYAPIILKATPSSALTNIATSNNTNLIWAFAVSGTTIVALEDIGSGNVRLKYSTNSGSSWTTGATYNRGNPDVRYLDGDFYFSVADGVYKGYTSPTKVGVDLDNAVATASAIVSLSEIKEGFVHSTANNGSSFTYTNLPNTQNVPGKLEYDVTSTLEPFGTFDVWFRLQSRDTFLPQFIVRWIDDDYYVTIERDLFGKLFIRYNNGRYEETAYANRFDVAVDTWHHLRITRSGSTSSFYLNGSRQWTTTAITWPTTPFDLVGDGSNFDELYVTTDVLTSPSETSYSVPTQPYNSSSLLVHFDTDFSSSTEATFDVEADFEAFGSSSVTADPNTKIVDASLTTTASLSVTANVLAPVGADFTVTASLAADNTRLKTFESSKDSEFTLTADAQAVITITDVLLSDFAITLTAVAQRVGDIDLFPEFTAAIDGNAVRGAESTMQGFAATTGTINDLVKEGAATPSAQFTQTTNGGKLIEATANITDALAFNVTATKFKGFALLTLPGTASLTATANYIANHSATASTAFSVTAQAQNNEHADWSEYTNIFSTGFNFSVQTRFFSNDPNDSYDRLVDMGLTGDVSKLTEYGVPNRNVVSHTYTNAQGDDYHFLGVTYLERVSTGVYRITQYSFNAESADSVTDALSTNTWRTTAITSPSGGGNPTFSYNGSSLLAYQGTGYIPESGTYNIPIVGDPARVVFPVNTSNLPADTSTEQNYSYTKTGTNYGLPTPIVMSASGHAQFTLAAQALQVFIGDATISTTATLGATANITRSTTSTLNSTATVTCEFTEIDSFEADFTATATLGVDVTRIQPLQAVLDTASTISLTPTKIVSVEVDAASLYLEEFYFDGAYVRTRGAEFRVIATARRNRLFDGTLSAQFTQTTDGARIRIAETDFDSIATTLVAVGINATGTITAESRFTLTATVNAQTETTALLDATATLTAQTGPLRGFEADFTATATLEADATRIQPTGFDVTATATLLAQTEQSVTRNTSSSQSSTATLGADATRIQQGSSALTSTATLSAAYDVFVIAESTLEAQATVLAITGRTRSAEAQLEGFSATVTAGRVITIDEFTTLLVPQETRVLKILPESRVLQVEQETRINIIKGQQL